jgi:hypothetical protein
MSVQHGDYLGARCRLAAGEAETYGGQRYSVGALERLLAGFHHLVVSLEGPVGSDSKVWARTFRKAARDGSRVAGGSVVVRRRFLRSCTGLTADHFKALKHKRSVQKHENYGIIASAECESERQKLVQQ